MTASERPDEIGVIEKAGNAFFMRLEGENIGEITFVPVEDGTWLLDHTYVDPQYRGGSIARRLLQRVADEARAEGAKIVPVCSYAVTQFKRDPGYSDVWKRNP